MLQVFRIGVAKVDPDIAYIAMAMLICFKYMFQMLSVSDVCFKCFHLDVTKVDLDVAYTYMLHAYVSSVLLQFHLDVE
jgi:hypothetical protein